MKEKIEGSLKEQVQDALDVIRPQMQADGGDIELIDVTEDGMVKVRLVGACSGCPGAQMTLQMGVERVLKSRVPGIKSVEAI